MVLFVNKLLCLYYILFPSFCKCFKKENLIGAILVKPGEKAEVVTIKDDLDVMQDIVGGMIEEYMPIEDDVAIICNEEGKMLELPFNRAIRDKNGNVLDIVLGTFFICYAPTESECFLSLPEDLKEKYLKLFLEPEFLRRRTARNILWDFDEEEGVNLPE